jgi:hypothetical protein
VGQASLTVEVSTGRPHVLVGGDFGVKYYTPGSGKWNGLTLSSHQAFSVAIRLHQTEGTLFAVYARIQDSEGPNLYYLTKP